MIGGGEMGRRVRDMDWSKTPLDAYTSWPQSLRSALSLVLNTKGIAALYWGPEQWLLYNDAYGAVLGERHPWAFGRPMPEALPDLAPVLGPQVAQVLATGEGFAIENLTMVMRRNGRDEDTAWTYSFSPVQGEDGGFAGVLLLATEMTRQRAAEHSRDRAEAELQELNRTLELQVAERTRERDRIWHMSRDMLGVADDRGVWLSVSPAWTRILGWREDEIVGRTSEWMEHPDDSAKTRAEVSGLAAGRTTLEFENRFRTRDGDHRCLSWTAAPADGLLYCVARDVTDVRAQEALVAEQAAARERTWHYTPDLLSVIDMPTGTFERVNPAWAATLGWPTGEVEGRSFRDFVHPGDLDATMTALASLRLGEPLFRFENRYRTAGGDWRWLSWVAFPEGDKLYSSTRDVTGEKELTDRLRLYEDVIQASAAPICVFDTAYRLIAFNRAHSDEFFRIFSYRVRVGDVFPDLFPPDQAPIVRGFMDRALAGEAYTTAEEFGDPDLAKPYWEVSYSPLRDADNRVVGAFHYAKDITDRLRAAAELAATQEALRQSQKMEAVGQLTGGLAHDFNNLLTGISGSLDLLQKRVAQGRIGEVDRYVVAAQGAAKRAAALTHRLLAFSRRQTLDPKPTDVNRLVHDMADLIRRTVGPAVHLEVVGAVGLWTALVDSHQLENALLNLCINARDAMPDGGRLTVETGNKWMDDRAGKERDLPPGQYLSLCVSDTGTGMPSDVIERAFEPFFTTKPLGQGTGLGLSMIYGFARQSGGQVRIYSEMGEGTMVCVYLPRHYGEGEHHDDNARQNGETPRAIEGETVLVIDDEPTVRMLVADVLSDLGYGAIEAEDGPSGLRALQAAVRVDLLVTDVGLPGGMNGRQVADAARALRPGLKVLFITGYAENAAVGNGHLEPGMAVLTKPFAMDDLAGKIRDLIQS